MNTMTLGRQWKIIGMIFAVALSVGIVTIVVIELEVPMSEPARLLTAYTFIGAMGTVLGSVIAASALLWDRLLRAMRRPSARTR